MSLINKNWYCAEHRGSVHFFMIPITLLVAVFNGLILVTVYNGSLFCFVFYSWFEWSLPRECCQCKIFLFAHPIMYRGGGGSIYGSEGDLTPAHMFMNVLFMYV